MALDRRVSLSFTPLPNKILYERDERTVVVLVGIPARGKTYISRKITRYLNWIGVVTKVFNVGDYRKDKMHQRDPDFFNNDNVDAINIRMKSALDALHDLTQWLKRGGEIAVFDATNATRSRREMICEHCLNHKFRVIFVESICDNEELIEASILDIKDNCPEFVGANMETVLLEFLQRIKHYKSVYEPLDEELDRELSYIKIFNQGERFIVNRISGNLNSRIVYYLMNINVRKRTIYLVRHGESEFNLQERLGGDSPLSERGREFAEKLGKFMQSEVVSDLKVWTSHLRRTIETSQHIKCCRLEHWKALDELDAGICEGMTYKEIEKNYPVEFSNRDSNKFHYRYPMGESYEDLVARLEPVIMELERQSCVMVICHQAVARCLFAYFNEIDKVNLPYIKVPLHTVFKLTPTAYRCMVEANRLDVAAVDTHRSHPSQL